MHARLGKDSNQKASKKSTTIAETISDRVSKQRDLVVKTALLAQSETKTRNLSIQNPNMGKLKTVFCNPDLSKQNQNPRN